MWPEAIAASRRTRVGQRRGNGLLGFLLARGARLTEARFLLDTLRAEAYAGREDSYEIGALYAGLDKKDSAFIWLNRGIDDRSLDFEYLNTILDALSPDARLHALRQRIGIED